VDFVLSKNIPAIVFTGKFDDNIRNNILFRKIVDYVLKRDLTVLIILFPLSDALNEISQSKFLLLMILQLPEKIFADC